MKILVQLEVDQEKLKEIAENDDLHEALFKELGWCEQSGITVVKIIDRVSQSQVAMFCEAFQDLVDAKNIEFPNDDKPEDEPKTTIYGSDWDFLLDEVEGILENELGLTF